MFKVTLTKIVPRLQTKLTNPVIENWAFKLHYQLTATLLLVFVTLVCAREYFGDHIQCITDKGIAENVINTYCFFMATFTVVKHYDERLLQAELLPHPGVGPHSVSDETILHTYYQWVPFVLFIQAIFFYIPHYIWKKKEGGRLKTLVDGLQYATICGEKEFTVKAGKIPSKKDMEMKLNVITKDFMLRLKITRTWTSWMVTMEIINLVHIVLQIMIVDFFLKGRFMGLGASVISFGDWNGIVDPLEPIFPKVTKCTFHKYGPSGSMENHDALCVMALNIVHEKIYTVLWFWFLFVFIVSVLAVIWRIASFFLYRQSTRFSELMFQRASSATLDPEHIHRVVNSCQFEDWLFLYYLAKNMHAMVFQDLFARVAEELENRELMDSEGYQKIAAQNTFVNKIGFSNETHKDGKKAS